MNTWDETKRRRNFQDHGIDFHDLEGFFSGNLLTREDTREAYGERRYQSIGVFNGVALFVVWTPRGEDGDIAHLHFCQKGNKSYITARAGAWERATRKLFSAISELNPQAKRCGVYSVFMFKN